MAHALTDRNCKKKYPEIGNNKMFVNKVLCCNFDKK